MCTNNCYFRKTVHTTDSNSLILSLILSNKNPSKSAHHPHHLKIQWHRALHLISVTIIVSCFHRLVRLKMPLQDYNPSKQKSRHLSLPKMGHYKKPEQRQGVMTDPLNTHFKQIHQSTSSTQSCSAISPCGDSEFKPNTHFPRKPSQPLVH